MCAKRRVSESDARKTGARKPRSGEPGSVGEQGHREAASGNVWPASGPFPPGDAKVQPMGSFGQGERGAAGYEDSGSSEILPPERFSEPSDRSSPDDESRPDASTVRPRRRKSKARRAGLRPDERDPADLPGPPGSGAGDPYAAGEPGGGAAPGGLAGVNEGEGDVDDSEIAELENAFGSGIHDDEGSQKDEGPPYAGPSGGAVGGTPAEKRSSGGKVHRGLAPEDPS
jgi:hypothetical protein